MRYDVTVLWRWQKVLIYIDFLPLCILYKRLPKNTIKCGSEAQNILYTRTWTQSLLALHYIASFVCMPCKFESVLMVSFLFQIRNHMFRISQSLTDIWWKLYHPLQSCSVLALVQRMFLAFNEILKRRQISEMILGSHLHSWFVCKGLSVHIHLHDCI